jgi:hypothetical protein
MFAGSRAFGAAAFALSFICTGTRGEGNAQQICPYLLKGAMKRTILLVWLQAFFQASAQMPTRGIYTGLAQTVYVYIRHICTYRIYTYV